MKPSVVLYHPVPPETRQLLNKQFNLITFDKVDESNREDFLNACADADGMIGMGLPVPTQDLSRSANLKAIATISTGFDAFDVPWLSERRILLMNLFDPLTETTADLGFALLMATARRIAELDRKVRHGEWGKAVAKDWFGLDIHGKTLGIVGMGRIGFAIARRGALGCNMRVLYTSRTPKPEADSKLGARRCALDELLSESDFVCLVVPLSAETRHLIGTRELGLMKSSSILINIARGAVVDQDALIQALANNTIHAAGLDVFENEPLELDSALMQMDNVVLAPHIGSATQETRDAMARYAAESLIDFLIHDRVRNPVNPQVL